MLSKELRKWVKKAQDTKAKFIIKVATEKGKVYAEFASSAAVKRRIERNVVRQGGRVVTTYKVADLEKEICSVASDGEHKWMVMPGKKSICHYCLEKSTKVTPKEEALALVLTDEEKKTKPKSSNRRMRCKACFKWMMSNKATENTPLVQAQNGAGVCEDCIKNKKDSYAVRRILRGWTA